MVSIFEGTLRLLSPFMPFITEELWHAVYDGNPPRESIALAAYPKADEAQIDTTSETEMAILQDLIAAVRNIRTELKVERKQKLPIEIFADAQVRSWIERDRNAVELLADVEGVLFVENSLAKVAGARSTSRFDVRVVYEHKIDVAAERERLTKEVAKLSGELQRGTAQLSNEAFLAKAPTNVVEGLKKRKSEVEVLVEKAKAALDELEHRAAVVLREPFVDWTGRRVDRTSGKRAEGRLRHSGRHQRRLHRSRAARLSYHSCQAGLRALGAGLRATHPRYLCATRRQSHVASRRIAATLRYSTAYDSARGKPSR